MGFRNDLCKSRKTSSRTKQIYVFTTMEAEGEAWNPVMVYSAPHADQ